MPAMRKESGRGFSVCSCCSWNCLNSWSLLRCCATNPGCSPLIANKLSPFCIFFAMIWKSPSPFRLLRRSLRCFLLRSTLAKMSLMAQPYTNGISSSFVMYSRTLSIVAAVVVALPCAPFSALTFG